MINIEEHLNVLKEIARRNGNIIYYTEILEAIPNCSDEELKDLLVCLDSFGIEVVKKVKAFNMDNNIHVTSSKAYEEDGELQLSSSTISYLYDISSFKLLSAEEEKVYAREYHEGMLAQKELDKNKNLSDSQIKKLKIKINNGIDARDNLFNANTRLVYSIAKRFVNRGLELDDLIQEGNGGLLTACKNFDYTRNVRFSTYATYCINGSIKDAIYKKGSTIYVPKYVHEKMPKVFEELNRLQNELHRYPTYEELATATSYTVEEIANVFDSSSYISSLDWGVGDDDDCTLSDMVSDKIDTPFVWLLKQQQEAALNGAIERLTDTQEYVIRHSYGIGCEKQTLQEIANDLDCSHQYISKVKKFAEVLLRKDLAHNEYFTNTNSLE